jgi:cytochrome b561
MSDKVAAKPASWFMPAAIGALLFELLGAYMCASQLTVDPALLEPDQRLMWEAAPAWMLVAYVVAVTVGLAGAVMLVMRRAAAERLLLVSFIAVLVQFSALLIVPALRNLTDSEDLFLPFVIALLAYGVWQLARTARKRSWLT